MYMYQFLWHYIILVWDEVFGPWKTKFLSMTAMNVMPLMSTYVKLFYKLRSLITIFSYVGFENGFHDRFDKENVKNKNTLFNQHTKRIAQGPYRKQYQGIYTSYHKIAGFLEQIVRISFNVYRIQSFFM